MAEDIRIQMALDDLKSEDLQDRVKAMATLGEAGYKPAIPLLVEFLRAADKDTWSAAEAALRRMSGLAVLPGLLDLLRDEAFANKEAVIDLAQQAVERFGRELHDGPAAKMAAVVMQVSIIERLLDKDPERVAAELKELKELTSAASQEIRNIISNRNA